MGKFAEYQLATDFRSRKRFPLSVYFNGLPDTDIANTPLNIIEVKQRVKFQRQDGKEMEIDVMALSDDNRVVLVEVKKRNERVGITVVKDFLEKCNTYATMFADKKIMPAFLSTGGFTEEALLFCEDKEIGTAEKIEYFV
ncbi:conserved hypothetical protein [Desulfamplus magnetovallimortis]|uniref:Restriction endonuclease type IV Mrr domain-containing protein n=1 Tax=Desulfamplus magnetovallimortis TaxID=1246637 RepID=A0A1W1HG77_9BACT|nr:conserved hypothetical protein [Desulfamplus magnetovallimortis]